MRISVRGFIYHKEAETFDDCFDRYAINTNNNRFCVSDGVSSSFFPGIWADLLVNHFVQLDGRVDVENGALLSEVQKKWIEQVSEIVNKPDQKYFVRNFFLEERPAAATFVGLNFYKQNGTYRWDSFALGDSFLFFVPSNIVDVDLDFDKIEYLSSKQDFEFDNFPDFFDSRNSLIRGKIRSKTRELTAGTFYLMTDALSEWFITSKQSAVLEIQSWRNQKQFEKRIVELRKKSLHNDDSAILIIDVFNDEKNEIFYKEINVSSLEELIIAEKFSRSNRSSEVKVVADKFNTERLREDLNAEDVLKATSEAGYGKNKTQKKKPREKKFWEKKTKQLINYLLGRRNHFGGHSDDGDDPSIPDRDSSAPISPTDFPSALDKDLNSITRKF